MDRVLNNNVAQQFDSAIDLPCGHHVVGVPVSETKTKAYYRCPEGDGLQAVRKG